MARQPPNSTKGAAPSTDDRTDLVDLITDELLAEMPDLDRVEFEFTRRVGRLAAILEENMDRLIAPRGFTRSEYGVINALRSIGPPFESRPGALRARLLLTSGGVSNVLSRLEDDGLVKRSRDRVDGRGAIVRLTPEGVRVADEMMGDWAVAQKNLLTSAPREALATVATLLRDILLGLGDIPPPPVGGRRATSGARSAS
jgi:DNA-binding MarR family transcriptional regulator